MLGCAIASAAIFSPSASAQPIRADGALTQVGDVTTADNQNFTITGGTQLGENLFHGFETFSVPTSGSAVFTHSADITNIISRVTGGDISNIDGRLSTQGTNANVFLLNRSGIVFGANAQLNVGGAFIASTAENLRFSNGIDFATDNTPLNPLLSVSTPAGLQLGSASGAISVNDVGYTPLPGVTFPNITLDSAASLRVNSGQTMALIGSSLDFSGGVVAAPGGQVELGSVREGLVAFDTQNWRFDYAGVEAFGDMEFAARSLIDTSSLLFNSSGSPYAFGTQGGSIQLQGKTILFSEASRALIQNYSDSSSGNIQVTASESLTLDGAFSTGERGSGLATMNFGAGDGGHIFVVTPQLFLKGDTSIGTDTFGTGTSGDITIRAPDTIQFEGNQMAVPDFSQINTASFSAGASGKVDVITGDLIISGDDGISSQAAGSGAGGLVQVTANTITLENGGNIAASTLFSGESGDVQVTADTIDIRGSSPFSFLPSTITAPTTGAGDAGDVTVNARLINLSAGGRIDSSALASGSSGAIAINASEALTVEGTVPGTDIPSLIISSANVTSPEIRDFFTTINVFLPPEPSGTSGNVIITTPSLSVQDGAQVTVRNDGTGDAGSLIVNADSVYLSDRASITASTQQGSGGNIVLNLQDALVMRQGSQLSAEADGIGDGGNILLNAPVVIALENSDIIANAVRGAGGNIQINASAVLGTEFREQATPESDITASSQLGISGTVDVNSLEGDPATGTVALPKNVVDSSNQIAAGCDRVAENQFAATGRGGLPANPVNQIRQNRPWIDLRTVVRSQLTTAPQAVESEAIESGAIESEAIESENNLAALSAEPIEATGWAIQSGNVILTASSQPSYPNSAAPTCLQQVAALQPSR